MEHVLKYFETISDPRSSRNQKHPFMTLMGTSLLASLGGIDSFSGFSDFTESHYTVLNHYFSFPHGVPSHDTYQRFWDAIDPNEFYRSFEELTQSLAVLTGHLINIDGKTLRHSGKSHPLHIVSAWCQTNQLGLAQEKVVEKSNEIKAIPKLLHLLDLKNRTVTLDAMGAQRAICAQIISQGGDYIIALKGNQRKLNEAVSQYFKVTDVLKKCACYEECDKGHGRIEQRITHVSEEIKWLQKEQDWPGLKSIGQVHARVIKGEKVTEEKRFYISSLPGEAKILGQSVRGHWGIENQLHWRLDVVFNEDKGGIRNDNAAENIDILRKWALNVLQKAKDKPDRSIKSLMRKNAMSIQHLIACVKKIFHA
jgi:predicted transposase YbfD/YdcC